MAGARIVFNFAETKMGTLLRFTHEFRGLFRTYHGSAEYLADFRQLLSITRRLEIKSVVAQGADAVILYELETVAPVAATTLMTEWHHISGGKIANVQSIFDGRPFADRFGNNAV